MSNRKWNFNPGPAVLPLSVLTKAQPALVDFAGTGMGILEISHRSKDFEGVMTACKSRMSKLFGIPEGYEIGFFGAGANFQFSMLAMNFLPKDKAADYVDTGTWSSRAIDAAQLLGKVNVVASSKAQKYTRVPSLSELELNKDAAYVHMTSNNTIYGTQYREFPDTGDIPLICDMSSDIGSHRIDVSKFAMIYGGAQKNLGPAGVTLVIMRKDFMERCPKELPTMLNYQKFMGQNSLYNTPPVFAIFIVNLVLEWAEEQGGIEGIEKVNSRKAEVLYGAIDEQADFFRCPVEKASRSWMNVVFRLPSEDLEKKFLAEASSSGFMGLKGHRSVGGIRVSMYNAMPLEGIEKLVAFMKKFKAAN